MHNFDFLTPAAAVFITDAVVANYGDISKTGDAGGLRSLEDIFSQPVTNATLAACCQSGLWLLHNCLDESHAISQAIETPEGSYWHGIMHRMEGDFGNSRYWFRGVGQHPVFDSLDRDLPGGFDPSRFVDDCEAATGGEAALAAQCHDVAVAEWKALFEYCGNQAVG